MKIKAFILLCFVCIITAVYGQNKTKSVTTATALPRPKLVVGIVVDQMRWDYLYRFYDRYGSGGFKRMLNEGFTCENTNIDYIPTVTAIGHSTIYTGSVPALHGIAGNDFIVQATGKSMYCTEDTTVQTVGSTSVAGKMSPRNLLVTTVTDELKLATNFRSKVIGIALKDRGGILPAGHTANAAYWFDDKNASWITSTYYMKDLPQWVKDFNAKKLPEAYLKKDWNTLYPINSYAQTLPDESKYEGKFTGASTTSFPIKVGDLFNGNADIIRTTPYGNMLTLDLARAAIDNESMGKGAVTDFLAVSLSSPDYVGHKFGINAIEVEDIYLRLDKDLSDFFVYLDNKVGRGQYTVFLSADHGAAHNTGFLRDNNIPADVWDNAAAMRDMNKLLLDKYKTDRLVLSFTNYQFNLNNAAIAKAGLDETAIKADCIKFLEKQPGVAFAIDQRQAAVANVPEALRMRIINGYSRQNSGAIQVVLQPAWLNGRRIGQNSPTGTSHGTWNPYDTHIPLIFMGWGIKHGSTVRSTNMTDIAPTLAALLHIQAPNGNIGTAIQEVIK